ncbi:MAG: recombinase family protein [Anaerorhabdus sp.]
MAGRKSKTNQYNIRNNIDWKIGVYCRLSSDDGDKNESNSISNQRTIIEYHLKDEESACIVEYYIDDGYSGTNFDRPGFKSMICDIASGKINTIIVKDLSRFGRNYVGVGRYIEDILPLYNVRFIAINDNIDSFKDPTSINNIVVPFKNLMNDEYARDISNKVKSAYNSMAKSGKFVSGTTPYGYTKNPQNKHQLMIDEEEAKIVKLIYKRTLEGEGRIKICQYLNQNNILCRKEMQRRKNKNICLDDTNIESFYRWGTTTVARILTSEIYIGNLVFGKTGNLSYKIKKTVYKPKDEWIIVKNTHEPIISEDDFNEAQKLCKERTKGSSTEKKEDNQSIYIGKLKCGNCGSRMIKAEDYRKKTPRLNYYCMGGT